MNQERYIGVDLGGTKILTAVADEKGNIISKINIPTGVESGTERVLQNIYSSISTVMNAAELHKDNIAAIGIGSPGPLDIKRGLIIECSNLPFKNVPLVKLVKEKFSIPVRLENDASAAALGEKKFGAGQEVDNMLYITISTGVGGGIIVQGKVNYGFNGNAGEIGHMTLDPEGPVCGCGNRGCLEAFASGTAIARMARQEMEKGNLPLLQELVANKDEVEARKVARVAYQGEKKAREIFHRAGYYLGIGLANLVNLFNPELIVLGGGVMNAADLFWEQMYDSLQERALSTPCNVVKIKESTLGAEIGVKGAIAVAMEKMEE